MTRFIILFAVIGFSGSAFAASCSELPVLFVVQDKSGSMNSDPNGATATSASPSKWSVAQSVVPTVATKFANRFRFGAMMYPNATDRYNCTPAVLKTPVSEDASAIGRSYSSALAGGGTPTAVSLAAAKTYLLGLHLTTKAYVLLITDGVPNCNETLSTSTCTFITPTCHKTGCDLGAKDCLDDASATQAAADLNAANIPVFVVGFDPTLTSGNNLSVLNAIAAAGGTTKAYTASNRTQLETALSAIALDTATCCKDACTAGAAKCGTDGTVQTCAFDATIGCTVWNSKACGANSTCSSTTNACSGTCQDACTAGAARCTNQNAEQCVKGSGGCTSWTAGATCDSGRGESCVDGSCKVTCTDDCTEGAKQCGADGPQVCVKATACTTWQDLAACDSKSVCSEGTCLAKCAGELANCEVGTVCSDTSSGKACVPNAGKADAGVKTGSGTVKDITASGMGCNCQVVDPSAVPFLTGVLGLMWARRRRHNSSP